MRCSEDIVKQVNTLAPDEAEAILLKCCGSIRWAQFMRAKRPFADCAALERAMADAFSSLEAHDWREAFGAHPRVGGSAAAGSATAQWSSEEQAGVAHAGAVVLEDLAKYNLLYEKKFGHVFLICATGLGARDILDQLKERIRHDVAVERTVSAAEQIKIARLRFMKIEPPGAAGHDVSTHVLDTARGKPAVGVRVLFEQANGPKWTPLGEFRTDADGRIKRLHDAGTVLASGRYRLTFCVAAYHALQGVEGFYDEIPIEFRLRGTAQHFHVPLLLGPFGYSTYRGS